MSLDALHDAGTGVDSLDGGVRMAGMEWISVAERLPDNDQPVLVWNSGGYCQKPWAWWQICDYEDGKWREQDERDEYPGVTHWMPLPPEPPNWKPLFKHPEECL